MAGTTLGYLKFMLGFDTIEFRKGMSEAERDLAKLSKRIEKFGKGMADIGKKMSIGITAPIAAFAAIGIKEARETEEAMAQVNAVLSSMGDVSGKTADDLANLADELELHSLYEADQILRDVTTTLLTFKNISGDTFDRTQALVVGLATVLKTDLQSAAILVGKALNDPIKGMAALGRAGIQLDPVQKAQIKNFVALGQLAKAQAIILKELEAEFGNAAQAAQDADPYNKLQDAFKNLAEIVGTTLLPYLVSLADGATNLLNSFAKLSPSTQNLIMGLAAVAAAAGPLVFVFGSLIRLFASVRVVTVFAQGLLGLAAAEGTAATGATAAGIAIRGMLGPIGWIITAVGALYLAWRNWEKIDQIVQGVYASVKNFLGPNLTRILEGLLLPIKAVYWGFSQLMKLIGPPAKAQAKYTSDLGTAQAQLKYQFGQTATKADDAADSIAGVGKQAKAAKPEVDKLAAAGKQLYERLYPEKARALQFEQDIKALNHLKLNADEAADALDRLNAERAKEEGEARDELARKEGILTDLEPPAWMQDSEPIGITTVDPRTGHILDAVEQIKVANDKSLTEIGDLTHQKTIEMAKAWGEMASQAVGSMREMVTAFKGGDILGGIQKLLDLVLNLLTSMAKIGVFGKGAQTAMNNFGGARALGGPVVPGKTYMVGENGPELFSTKRSGFISPNRKEAQPQRVVVVPSPYFDVVVDHRAANVAAPMAGQAAVIGVTGSEARLVRRSRRNLLAA
jgi:hypothetical protein